MALDGERLMHSATLQEFIHKSGHQQGSRTITFSSNWLPTSARLQIELHRMGTVQAGLMDESGGRVDRPGGPDGDEEIALSQGRVDASSPRGISPNQTTWGRSGWETGSRNTALPAMEIPRHSIT